MKRRIGVGLGVGVSVNSGRKSTSRGWITKYGSDISRYLKSFDNKDTILIAEIASTNYGIDWGCIVGERAGASLKSRSILGFDWDTESFDVLNKAYGVIRLHLTIRGGFGTWATENCIIEVRRIKRGWLEGTKNGSGVADGATWDTYDGVNNWGTAGAGGEADIYPEIIGTLTIAPSTIGEVIIPLSSTNITDLMAGHGILLKTESELNDAFVFASREFYPGKQKPYIMQEVTGNYKGALSPIFEKHISGKQMVGSFGSVVYVNDNSYMAYHGEGNTTMGRAIQRRSSNDGITWSAATTIIDAGTGKWAGCPFAWKEGDNWYMLYRSNEYGSTIDICLATSNDGLSWNKSASNPVIDKTDVGAWVTSHLDPWGVIKVGDIYYLMLNDTGEYPRQTGVATSTDLINWTMNLANPIFDNNRFCSDVFKYKDKYYAVITYSLYAAENKYYPKAHRFELYRDDAPTFLPNSREFLGNIMFNGDSGEWDSTYLDTPCFVTKTIERDTFPHDKLWIYYTGALTSTDWGMGLATGSFKILDDLEAIQPPDAGM